jgi:DNA-binding LytR/AlgR family response regulator
MLIKEKLYQFSKSLNDNLKLFVSISLGIFLFILFFQPFPLDSFDFNNKLIFVSGFGAIVYLIMFLVRVVFSWIFLDKNKNGYDPVFASTMSGFIIMVLSSVSFAFYLRYVGSGTITFFIMIKIILICLVPPVILSIYDKTKNLAQQNESLILEKKIIQHQIEKYEEDYLNKSIELISDNNTENLNLLIAELAFIKSADNYVEVVYKEGDTLKKKLLRNTLKNIEQQLRQYTNFIRCHRTCVVNVHFVDKLTRTYNNHWLVIKEYHEQIPVSRQYLLKLKEVL